MPFSYADAIKRQHNKPRLQEDFKRRKQIVSAADKGRQSGERNGKPNPKIHARSNLPSNSYGKTKSTHDSSFHDAEMQDLQDSSYQAIPTEVHRPRNCRDNRVANTKDGSSVPKSGISWKTIANEPKSTGLPFPKEPSDQNKSSRKGKRKAFNVNSVDNRQKSSKPKPSQRSVSLGDLINPRTAKKKGKKSTVGPGLTRSNTDRPQTGSIVDFPALSSSQKKSPPPASKWAEPTRRVAAIVLKRDNAQSTPTMKKFKTKKGSAKRDSSLDHTSSIAATFLKPREHDERPCDGDEHKLLRLMQERTVYKKKGRQRVAPRKKKLTALKKKVLQERLKKWQELHPDGNDSVEKSKKNLTISDATLRCSTSVCLYNYASGVDLEEDDEFEEVEQNLKEMASKVADVEHVFVPRGLSRSSDYPVFVRFKTLAGAFAAKACWDGLVIAGDKLTTACIDDSQFSSDSVWTERMLVAESKNGFSRANKNGKPESTTEVTIEDILLEDDYEDPDCMEESLSFLKEVAAKYAEILTVLPSTERDGNVVLVCSGDSTKAQALVRGLCDTIVSGKPLSASLKDSNDQALQSKSLSLITLENLLTKDDFDDKECLEETLSDVKELIERYGKVVEIGTSGDAVQIYFMGMASSTLAVVAEMNGMVLGGTTVSARIEDAGGSTILLRNILTEDDVDDDDCLEETFNDIRKLVAKYGDISALNVHDQKMLIVKFVPDTLRSKIDAVATELSGVVIGGQVVSVSTFLPDNTTGTEMDDMPQSPASGVPVKDKMVKPKMSLYSGDKLIPAFFAKCKQVPKVPNSTGPRDYAKAPNDERVRPLLTEMLRELMRLQKRAIEDKNAKARRRLVMGLREVCRGIRSHKVKMVVMANNLDEYGAIDAKLQEIIDLARAESIPLFFEFTKRSLGRALGKTIKVAVVGIQNADGANQEFKKLATIQQR